jgi:hypothetical protein
VAVPGNPEWALPKISSDWKNMNIRNKPSLLHIFVPLFCILLFGCGIPYDFFSTHKDELLRNETFGFQNIWLCPDPAFDSRRRIVLKGFPLRTKYPWRLSMHYQNIDDDDENELVMLLESAIDGNKITMKAVILVDDSTHGYALLDVVRPYFMTSGIEDTYLFDFAKKYYGKLVNFRTKDAINIVALSHPPAKSAFDIDFYILEIRGGKIKTILDKSRIYRDSHDFYPGDAFQTSYRQAVNAYKDKTGDADMPVNQYKKIYAWDEAEEQYVLQSEARTEYVKLDVN